MNIESTVNNQRIGIKFEYLEVNVEYIGVYEGLN